MIAQPNTMYLQSDKQRVRQSNTLGTGWDDSAVRGASALARDSGLATPAPGALTPSSGLHGFQHAHGAHEHMQIHTQV